MRPLIEADDQGRSERAEHTTADLALHAWLDRDLSWLEFNRRVLSEALDERNPLLERVKFLAIFSSNLDEFFMKRMAVIRPLTEDTSVAAEERRNVISRRRETITSMLAEQAACYTDVIRPELAEHRIHLVDWGDLTVAQRDEASILFDKEISPVLTPLSLDAAHPFPYVSNLSTSWAFRLEDPVSGEEVLVRLKVPRELPQWVRVRAGVEPPERVYVGLEQVIAANAERLFPGLPGAGSGNRLNTGTAASLRRARRIGRTHYRPRTGIDVREGALAIDDRGT